MSYGDFCNCTFGEFESILEAWREMTEGCSRDSWERTRTLAAICIQPHTRKKLTPRQLLPFPWDMKHMPKKEAPRLSAEEQRMRFERLVRRLGDEINP